MQFFLLLISLLIFIALCSADRPSEPAIIHISNSTNIKFKDDSQLTILHNYGSHVLLGGRNAVYNVSLHHMAITYSYVWPTSRESYEECTLITNANCHNYIRSYYMKSPTRIVFCGTHGRHPTCKEFEVLSSRSFNEWEGVGLSPFIEDESNPFLNAHGQIFAVNVPEYSGTDAILLRMNTSKSDNMIRTARRESVFDDAKVLALEPNGNELFTFFAETPSEREEYGQKRVARVARVCMDDPGAEYHKDEWSSFAKARIECGIKEMDMNTLYFNLLVSVSPTSDYFIGAFRSQLAALNGSAICLFRRKDLSHTFRSAFTSSPKNSNRCPRAVSRDEQTKMRGKPLINSSVFSTPSFHYYGNDLFTSIAVEENVEDLNGEVYDIWYIGTNLGHIMKVWYSDGKAHHFATFKFMEENSPIRSIFIHTEHLPTSSKDVNKASYLIVQTKNELVRLPTSACSMQTTCTACLSFHDPSCAWVSLGSDCVNIHENQHRRSLLTQDHCEKSEKKRRIPPATTQAPMCGARIIEETDPRIVEATILKTLAEAPYILVFVSGLLFGALFIHLVYSWKSYKRCPLQEKPAVISAYNEMMRSRTSSHIMSSSRSTYC
ncbi:unnamed protein product [Auanema sp. JU1783]|nr:unnamed protein product [Auanema sp. JU1783]